jgi:hypothetical protein
MNLFWWQRSKPSNTVFDIPDEELLRRAVQSARANIRKGVKHYRWVAVKDAFLLGSTYSQQLCVRFGYDPDELVHR